MPLPRIGSTDFVTTAARPTKRAPRDNCLGLRSSHAVAWHKHDIVTLIANRSVLVDGIAGAGPDALASAMRQDVARAVSVLTRA
jgi:hypothetical protein